MAETLKFYTVDMHDVFAYFGIQVYVFPQIQVMALNGPRLGKYGSGI